MAALMTSCAGHQAISTIEDNANYLCSAHGGLKAKDVTDVGYKTYSLSVVCNDLSHFYVRENVKP